MEKTSKNIKQEDSKEKKIINQEQINQEQKKEKAEANPDKVEIFESVLLYPITTEKVINSIESQNQLVFATTLNATKKQIKEEFEKQFKVKVKKVNTKISSKGVKYAYIKLKEGKADDIAAQLKMI